MARPKVQAGGILRKSLASDWRTPEHVLEAARQFFGGPIPFEAIWEAHDKRVKGSGLEVQWPIEGAWVNPPYGSELRAALAKCVIEAKRGVSMLVLLPVNRCEVAWMQDFARAADAVCLIRKRLAFISAIDGVAVGGNPFASWVWGLNVDRDVFREAWSPLGLCLAVEEIQA